MTKEELAALPALRREITRIKRRLATLRGMPRTNSPALQAKIADLTATYEAYLTKAAAEEAEIVRYIRAIDDPSVREIFLLRYAEGIRSWQRIAFAAGEHDESYVRRKHNKYLREHEGA